MQETPGVESVKVDFGKKEATVQLKDDVGNFDRTKLIDSLKNAGFDGKVID